MLLTPSLCLSDPPFAFGRERASTGCLPAMSPHEAPSLLCVQVLHAELPTTLDAMERASLEFEELGKRFNILTAPLRPKHAKVPTPAAPKDAAAPQEGSGSSMRRIVSDVAALTTVSANAHTSDAVGLRVTYRLVAG